MRKKSFPAGGLGGGFMEEMAQQLGHEGQTKFKYGDVAEYIGGRENDTNGMNLRWWVRKSSALGWHRNAVGSDGEGS